MSSGRHHTEMVTGAYPRVYIVKGGRVHIVADKGYGPISYPSTPIYPYARHAVTPDE
jgi:hypothetical protein